MHEGLIKLAVPMAAGFFLCASLLLCQACSIELTFFSTQRSLTMLSWNVQNLYDDQYQGGEYAEFDPRKGSWSTAMYWKRLETAAAVIRRSTPTEPDVLVLLEVENQRVLVDLCRLQFPASNYQVVFAPARSGGPGFGVLSRLPVRYKRLHGVAADGANSRPVLEIALQTAAGDLIVFASHWKSKRTQAAGETDGGELLRKAAAGVIAERCEELRQSNHSGILLLGDLNTGIETNPDQALHYHNPAVCAGHGHDSLCVGDGAWFSPYGIKDVHTGPAGSYWYRGEYLAIDHALLAPSPLKAVPGWKLERFRVVQDESACDSFGHPERFDSRTRRGVSDHLPILLEFTAATDRTVP